MSASGREADGALWPATPEAILEAYPSIRRLGKIYGAIAFILDHPDEVEAYLKDRERLFEAIQKQFPMSRDMIDRFERARWDVALGLV